MSSTPEVAELASRILANLYEAGSENVSSTLNTILHPVGSKEEPNAMAAAAASLLAADLIYLTRAVDHPGRGIRIVGDEAQAFTSDFAASMNFNSERRIWTWVEAIPMVELVLTEAGNEEAYRILDERGHQWWRDQS